MTTTASTKAVRIISGLALVMALFVCVEALWVLALYALDAWPVAVMRGTVSPANPASTILTGLTAVAVLLQVLAKDNKTTAAIGKVIGGVVFFFGALKVVGTLTGTDVAFDHVLFAEQMQGAFPNRMATNAGVAYALLGASVFLLFAKKLPRLADAFSYGAFLLAYLSAVGYAFGERSLSGFGWERPVSLHSVIGLMMLSQAVLLARPQEGSTAILTDEGTAGTAARWLLPASFWVPFITGLLFLQHEATVRLAFVTVTCSVVFCFILSAVIGRLKAIDRERQHATQRMRDFLFRTIHDLRSPTNVVRLSLDMHVETAKERGENTESDKHIGYLRDASGRMAELIEDLCKVAKGSDEALALPCENLDLDAVIAGVVAQQVSAAEANGMSVTHASAQGRTDVFGNESALKEVLENLVSNAVKYGKPGGTVRVSSELAQDKAVVRVWDDGTGIAPENLPPLFDPYFRVPGTGKSGTGLGLYIVKQLVEKMGGTVRCDSVKGEWTEFTFTVPLAKKD